MHLKSTYLTDENDIEIDTILLNNIVHDKVHTRDLIIYRLFFHVAYSSISSAIDDVSSLEKSINLYVWFDLHDNNDLDYDMLRYYRQNPKQANYDKMIRDFTNDIFDIAETYFERSKKGK